MKKILVFALAIAAVSLISVLSTPVVAGDDHGHAYRCSEEAQTCLNAMASRFDGRGWAGVEMEYTEAGPTVKAVHSGTPASRAGVQVGDVLTAINGVEISEDNKEKLGALELEMKPGKIFTYSISRKGKEREVQFALAEMPIEIAAKLVGQHMIEQHTTVEIASAGSN
jgi:C-terminal processing protease CtpA/Prc